MPPTTWVAWSCVMPEKRSWNCGSHAPMPATVNMSALTPTERVAQRGDRPDRAEVLAQAVHHVDEEAPEPVLEQRHVRVRLVVVGDAQVHAVTVTALRFVQRVREERDRDARWADDQERGLPAEV